MKTIHVSKISILTLCFSIISSISFAQNWRTISTTDTTYFYVTTDTLSYDSILNGYLRSTFVASTSTVANYEISNFPFSTRKNATGQYDTLNGSSWLGRKNIYNTLTGEEYYFNVLNDTIKINTLGLLNDSWILASDTSGHVFVGTISNLDTMTIDGVIDSVKTISIQAFIGTSPVAHYYNNFSLQLSKNHGFTKTLEFYIFPNLGVSYNYFPYPVLQYQHSRLEKSITDINYNNIDLAWKYSPGNEWIFSSKSGQDKYIYHDSIISSNQIAPDTFEVTYYKHLFTHIQFPVSPPHDTMYHTYSTITDTFYNNTDIFKLKNYILEDTIPSGLPIAINFRWEFLDFKCGKVQIKDTLRFNSWLSGGGMSSNTLLQDFGIRKVNYYFSDMTAPTQSGNTLPIYLKLGACEIGDKLNFRALSVNDLQLNSSSLLLYPNPSNNRIQIINSENIPIKTYSIKDISGKVIATNSFQNEIDISLLPNGIYFIEFRSDKGTVVKKLVKN